MTDESENTAAEQETPANQKQMSPATASLLLAAIVFGYIVYSTSDVLRAGMISAIAFVGTYWVMSRGQALEAKRAKRNERKESQKSVR